MQALPGPPAATARRRALTGHPTEALIWKRNTNPAETCLRGSRDLDFHQGSRKEGGSVMELLVERADVCAATIPDRPGGLAEVLTTLREAGADLQFIIARRAPEAPGKGVVFVTPLQGDREIRAAAQVGFNVAQSLHSVRVMGPDRPGIAAELAQKLADGGINLRGFSASVIGAQFVAHMAVDSLDDVNKVIEILEKA